LEEANVRKILIIVLAFILTLALSVTSVTFAAGGKKEVNLAQEAGQAWLDSTVAVTGEPLEWVGARLTTPQVCHNLKGKPNAYMFAVENDGEVVGYITVGSSDYGYAMFEAADVPPPAIPSADKVKSTLKRDLGLDVASIGRPTRLLYLGFDNVFAVYKAGGQEVAVDLKFDFAMPASNLAAIAAMRSPEEYKADREAAEQAKLEELADAVPTAQTRTYYWLTMSHWCYKYCPDCNPEYKCWCGPSSGVSIGAYYKYDHSPPYTRLPDAGENQCQMYLRLFDEMETSCTTGGTKTTNYGPGFVAMTWDPNGDGNPNDGYGTTFTYVTKKWPSNYYPTIKNYIDSGWPTAFRAYRFYDDISDPNNPDFPPPGAHYIAIKGYWDGWHGYDRVLICTDSYSHADWLYINYGISGLFPWFITIKDSGI
jgi:hypothetical protein